MVIPYFDLKGLNLGKINIELIRVRKVEEAFAHIFKK
jgi:hypothetical protein